MKRSEQRILTTHVGSLARPPELVEQLRAQALGEAMDQVALDGAISDAVAKVVAKQVESGVDVVSDGEQSKLMFHSYVTTRLTGFEPRPTSQAMRFADLQDFPEYAALGVAARTTAHCIGPIEWAGDAAVERDIANLGAALENVPYVEAFIPSASPGIVAQDLPNEYYPTEDAYIEALADALSHEYRAIVNAGFLVQIDAPDVAAWRHRSYPPLPYSEHRQVAARNIEILNEALAGIPKDRVRFHLCWGNYPGPHHYDIPMRDIADIMLRAHAGSFSFKGANGRHEHEWRVWEEIKLPDDTILAPGVIDTNSNIIEHPELVAERIVRYAQVVGRERVIASTDCGFATAAFSPPVFPSVAWAKLAAMAEGARLATRQLWP